MDADKKDEIYSDFYDCVNMQPKELEEWLDTEESKSVGDSDSGESTGHKSGRRIIEIKNTKKADLTDSQYEHMQRWWAMCTAIWRRSRRAILRTAIGATAS